MHFDVSMVFKFRKRFAQVAGHSLRNFLLPIMNMFISILVIRLTSIEFWGRFIYLLIVVSFAVHVLGWGSKEYLLRLFSRNPARLADRWQGNLLTRLLLFILLAGFIFIFNIPFHLKILILFWVLAMVLYQSYEVVILYKKRFLTAVVVEIIGFLFFATAIILFRENITLNLLILFFGIATALKGLFFSFCFRKVLFSRWFPRVEFRQLTAAFPFFILGLSGMLHSRIDLYCVAYFLDRASVGKYQVFIQLFLYLQSLAYFLIAPFIQNIYRLPQDSLKRLRRFVLKIGILCTLVGTPGIFMVVSTYYGINLPFEMYPLGTAFTLPIFVYIIRIYTLFKYDFQQVVVGITFLGTFLNMILNIWLIPILGITGAIYSTAAIQWVLLGVYSLLGRIWQPGKTGIQACNSIREMTR